VAEWLKAAVLFAPANPPEAEKPFDREAAVNTAVYIVD
jgi:hypothetical protein